MKHKLLSALILASAALIPHTAFSKDVVLHVYSQIPGSVQGWALVPVISDLPDASAETIFNALRRKKLPTYGNSTLGANGNVTIDPAKCPYAAIISTELARSFEENGFKLGTVSCGGTVTTPDSSALAGMVPVIPVWQALTPLEANTRLSPETRVQLDDGLLRYDDFKQRLAKGDKKLIKAIEAAFDAESAFVQRQTMSAAINASVPGAESLVAKRLTAKTLTSRAAAMRALRPTSNAKLVKQMNDALVKAPSSDKLVLAEAALGASDASLNKMAALALLASNNDELFSQALSVLTPSDVTPVLPASLDQAKMPSHAARIAMTQAKTDQAALRAWLDASRPTPNAVAVADAVLAQDAFSLQTKEAAHAIFLLSDDFERAELSFYALTGRSLFDTVSELQFAQGSQAAFELERASKADDSVVRWAARNALQGEVVPHDTFDAVAMQKRAFDADVNVRLAVAAELVTVDSSADAIRSALIKDSDANVVQTMVNSLAMSHAARYARELTNIAKMQDVPTRRVIIRALPDMLDDENANAVMAFISNELFDGDSSIRITAMYALAEIARRTNDPVLADNAVTSISMTLQDKDERIQWHTILALAATQMGSAKSLIESSDNTQAVKTALTRLK